MKEDIKDREQLAILVDDIIRAKGDPEVVHIEEDKLYLRLIRQFCPDWVKEEIERLNNADFPRWHA